MLVLEIIIIVWTTSNDYLNEELKKKKVLLFVSLSSVFLPAFYFMMIFAVSDIYLSATSMDRLITLMLLKHRCHQNQDHLLEQPLLLLCQFHQMHRVLLPFHWHGTVLRLPSRAGEVITGGRLAASLT